MAIKVRRTPSREVKTAFGTVYIPSSQVTYRQAAFKGAMRKHDGFKHERLEPVRDLCDTAASYRASGPRALVKVRRAGIIIRTVA